MLNTAQRVTDKELEDIDVKVESHERIILGDPENGKIGVAAQFDALETLVNELRAELRNVRATLHGDHTGHPGLESRVDAMEGRRARRDLREGYFWHFVTALGVQALFVIALLILNWERVEDFIKSRLHHPPAQKIEPQKRHKRHKPKPILIPEAQQDEPATEEMP